MSRDEAVSAVLDGFSELRKLLDDAEDLKQCLKIKKSSLKKSKKYVDQLCILSDKIKTNFYEKYNSLDIEKSKDIENDTDISKDNESGTENTKDIESGTENAKNIESDTENAKDIESGTENAKDIESGTENAKDIESGTENAKDIESGTENAKDIESNSENAKDIESGTENANDVEIGTENSKDIESDTELSTTNNICENNEILTTTNISIVDLLDTTTNMSENDLDSVAINTTEINEVEETNGNKDDENVMNEDASEDEAVPSSPRNDVAESADIKPDISKSKEGDNDDLEKAPALNKSIIRLVDLNKLIDPKQKKSVKFDSSVIILTSSDDEAPVSPNVNKENESRSPPKSPQKRTTRSKTKVEIIDNEEQEDDTNSRKSSRLKDIQKKKSCKKEEFKKIFKRSSEKSFEIVSKKSKKNKAKKDSSSSDDEEKSKVSNKKPLKTDAKFERKVYVPLPLIQCDKLKEAYKRNKDLFACKRSTRVGKKTKRTTQNENDSDNAQKKKSRTDKNDVEEEKTIDKDDEVIENGGEDILDDKNEDVADKIEENGEKEVESKTGKDKKKDKNEESDGSSTEDDSKNRQNKNGPKMKESENADEIIEAMEVSSDGSDKEEENGKSSKKVVKTNGDETNLNKTDSEDESLKKTQKTKKESKSKKLSIQIKKSVLTDSEEENTDKEETKKKSGESSDDEKQSGSDTDEKKVKKKVKKKKVKKIVLSDSDEEDNKTKEKDDKSDSSSSEDKDSDSDSSKEQDEDSTKKKRRIKKVRNSSSDSEEEVKTRKQIRKVLDKNELSETTKKAEEEEKNRKARIAEKQKKYNRIFEEKIDAVVESVVLDYDEKTKEPHISVHKKIVKNLKPHQVSGIQFMYDACFESTKQSTKSAGSGCILAHCMGLGKTLQVVALAHTLLTNREETKVEKVMVVCPINTVLNWKAEFKKWVPKKSNIEVFELATARNNYEKQCFVKEWHEDGGVLIIGYHMFRNLSNPKNKRLSKKLRETFHEGMVDPGPDLVVCDEGHLLKNEKTHLSIAMNRIKTARRIVLTGTPLQNNLKEYWCMVQFIKPNLLGTYKEYMNRFVNPITNGQYTDSTQRDTILMRKRSHVLHKLLDGVVQRRDYSVLEPYLPPKYEYILFVKLSETQIKLYQHYMDNYARNQNESNRTSFLFTDFQKLQRICTHPRVLLDQTNEKKEKLTDEEEDSEGSLKEFIDDGEESAASSSSSSSNSKKSGSDTDDSQKKKSKSKSRVTRALAAQRKENNEEGSDIEIEEVVRKEWWQEFCDGEELDNIKNSGKLSLLFEVLKECEEIGDKILIFSQSLYTLNCIEYFLNKIDEATQNGETEKVGGYKGSWELGLDYFRIDGSSSCDNRAYWCDSFNNPENIRARLFLISTKAGGLGINLVAANRVIIFDVSWNPSHDIQSIYRVYRFGQTKPSYIYRFVTYGTMEMKIYERQVTKQAISKRVIDEQQIDRHYNQNDLQELYKCDLDPTDRPIPLVPKDVLLGEMLQKYDKIIYKYHLHQSLLENKQNECLNEEERKAAWDEFENEKVLRKTSTFTSQAYFGPASNMSAQNINAALTNIVKRDNPTWTETQIKGIIPALVRQLQIQIEENDMSMYQRVVQEIQIMQQAKLKESYYQQQMMKYYQQQIYLQRQQALMGNLNITPQNLQSLLLGSGANANGIQQFPNGPSTSSQSRPTNDVIELND